MKKKSKLSLYIPITILFSYFIYFLFRFFVNGYSCEWDKWREYQWIYTDSIKKDIDTQFCVSLVRKQDVCNFFNFKNHNYIDIWEFKDLNLLQFDNCYFNTNTDLNGIKIKNGELFGKNEPLEISVDYDFNFTNQLNINLDDKSKIIQAIDSTNLKGFNGLVNKMSFSDKTGRHKIIFDFIGVPTPITFLLYKVRNSFYVIIIKQKINEFREINEILKLR